MYIYKLFCCSFFILKNFKKPNWPQKLTIYGLRLIIIIIIITIKYNRIQIVNKISNYIVNTKSDDREKNGFEIKNQKKCVWLRLRNSNIFLFSFVFFPSSFFCVYIHTQCIHIHYYILSFS